MACQTLQLPTPPQLPDIFKPVSLAPNISFGEAGVTCCSFKLPSFSPPISIPLPPAAVLTLMTTLNALIVAAMPVLDQIQIPKCPL